MHTNLNALVARRHAAAAELRNMPGTRHNFVAAAVLMAELAELDELIASQSQQDHAASKRHFWTRRAA